MDGEKNFGCFVCSGPIDQSAGRVMLDIENADGSHDIYVMCARCGASTRREVEQIAKGARC